MRCEHICKEHVFSVFVSAVCRACQAEGEEALRLSAEGEGCGGKKSPESSGCPRGLAVHGDSGGDFYIHLLRRGTCGKGCVRCMGEDGV